MKIKIASLLKLSALSLILVAGLSAPKTISKSRPAEMDLTQSPQKKVRPSSPESVAPIGSPSSRSSNNFEDYSGYGSPSTSSMSAQSASSFGWNSPINRTQSPEDDILSLLLPDPMGFTPYQDELSYALDTPTPHPSPTKQPVASCNQSLLPGPDKSFSNGYDCSMNTPNPSPVKRSATNTDLNLLPDPMRFLSPLNGYNFSMNTPHPSPVKTTTSEPADFTTVINALSIFISNQQIARIKHTDLVDPVSEFAAFTAFADKCNEEHERLVKNQLELNIIGRSITVLIAKISVEISENQFAPDFRIGNTRALENWAKNILRNKEEILNIARIKNNPLVGQEFKDAYQAVVIARKIQQTFKRRNALQLNRLHLKNSMQFQS